MDGDGDGDGDGGPPERSSFALVFIQWYLSVVGLTRVRSKPLAGRRCGCSFVRQRNGKQLELTLLQKMRTSRNKMQPEMMDACVSIYLGFG